MKFLEIISSISTAIFITLIIYSIYTIWRTHKLLDKKRTPDVMVKMLTYIRREMRLCLIISILIPISYLDSMFKFDDLTWLGSYILAGFLSFIWVNCYTNCKKFYRKVIEDVMKSNNIEIIKATKKFWKLKSGNWFEQMFF